MTDHYFELCTVHACIWEVIKIISGNMAHMIVNLCYCQAKKTKEEATQMNAQSNTIIRMYMSLYNKHCMIFLFMKTQ